MIQTHATPNSERHQPSTELVSLLTLKTPSASLDLLVRISLQNKELAPGVAVQVNLYREGTLSPEQKRLLAILDDAIADGSVTVIELPNVQPEGARVDTSVKTLAIA